MAVYLGTIKSFNPQKGWGFVQCEETHQLYNKDIFVHQRNLPLGGADRGDQVTFSVREANGGPEAADVQLVARAASQLGGFAATPVAASAGAAFGGQAAAAAAFGAAAPGVAAGGKRHTGVVKSFNPVTGWGFVVSEALQQIYGKDVFFLQASVVDGQQVGPGTRVSFAVLERPNSKGPEAVEVRVIGSGSAPAAAFGGCAAPAWPKGGGAGKGGFPAFAALPGLPGNFAAAAVAAAAAARVAQGPRAVPGLGGLMFQMSSSDMFFGIVKGFSLEKGWGHITCEATFQQFNRDVFLMNGELKGQEVSPGTLVSFKVHIGDKGPQAREVTVLPPGAIALNGEPGIVHTGTIKSFNEQKGWGFITSDDVQRFFGKDLFVHNRNLGGATLQPGESVEFTVALDNRGQLEAKSVVPVGGYAPLRSLSAAGVAMPTRASPY